jgi:hypothetical protein
MLSDGAEEISGCGIRDGLNVELRKFEDGAAKLGFGNGEGDFLLVLELVEKAGEFRCDFALDNTRNLLQRASSAVKLYKLLVFNPMGGWSTGTDETASACRLTL